MLVGSHVTARQHGFSVPDMATIAALGTGVMGAPMARNLARAGHDVRAWNRSPDKAAALRDDGVDVATTRRPPRRAPTSC